MAKTPKAETKRPARRGQPLTSDADGGGGINLNANVGASIKLVRETRRHVSETIPEDVTRARNSRWFDLFSPITEWAGLKGDRRRHQRDLLRVQQEATLAAIATKLVEGRGTIVPPSRPLPNKFIVPFIEKASLEEADSPIVDLWANLLISATEGFKSEHLHFIELVHRLSSQQAKIFHSTIERAGDLGRLQVMHERHFMGGGTPLERFVQQCFEEDDRKQGPITSDDDFASFLVDVFDTPTVSIVHSSYENIATMDYYDIVFPYSIYLDQDSVEYDILEALGLLKRFETGFFDIAREEQRLWSTTVIFYGVTSLGLHFAKACKMLPADSAI